MIIPIICLILIIICNSEMDIISFKNNDALFQGWWSKKQNLSKLPLIDRTVLSFTQDGWHFCKCIMRLSEITLFVYCVLPGLPILKSVLFILFFYFISGVVFEILYNKKTLVKLIKK